MKVNDEVIFEVDKEKKIDGKMKTNNLLLQVLIQINVNDLFLFVEDEKVLDKDKEKIVIGKVEDTDIVDLINGEVLNQVDDCIRVEQVDVSVIKEKVSFIIV